MLRPCLAGTLGVAIAAACSAGTSGQSDRVAELEARVARLEAQLGARQAPADARAVELDASLKEPPPAAAVDAAPELSPHDWCLSQIERACRQYAAEPAAEGGLAWQKLVPPDATPAGRDCVAKARARCDAAEKQRHSWDKKLAALDAELAGPRLDRAFTDLVNQKLQAVGLVAHCTRQFCRLSDPAHVLDAGKIDVLGVISDLTRLDDAGGGMSIESYGNRYFTRGGYRFPE